MPGEDKDFVVSNGTQELLTGFEHGQDIQYIVFKALAWTDYDRRVLDTMVMAKNQVYKIDLTENGGRLAPSTGSSPNPAPIEDYFN